MKYLSFLFASLFSFSYAFAQSPLATEYIANVGNPYELEVNLGTNTSPVDGPMLFLLNAPEWAVADLIPTPITGSAMGDWILTAQGTPTIEHLGANEFIIGALSAWTGEINPLDTITVSVIMDCICPAVADPVCGIDGYTYGNSCEAACANVEVAYEGMCEELSNCSADVEILSQEVIFGFAGPMLHLQVLNMGNDLENSMASVNLGICPSTDTFTFDAWAEGEVMDMYYNFACLSMAPYIEPYEAELLIASSADCVDSFTFMFDPQGENTTEGCTDPDGTFYANGEEWNIDDCTFCSCMEGEIMCNVEMVVDCVMPPCDNPVYIEGQCCPVCEEEGCTDPISTNFNPEATNDDGSCEYELNYCNFMGGILEIGESIEVSGEVCTCDLVIYNEWDFNAALVFCVSEEQYACTADDGEFYPIGATLDGECETCICTESNLIPPPPPSWYCEEIPDCGDPEDCACFALYDPVCGSNGITYGNACIAECEGITDFEEGECTPIEPEEYGCSSDNGEFYPIGAIMDGECETCICTLSMDAVFPPETYWECVEIADCGGIEDLGCISANGEFYPIGAMMDGECETCICTESDLTVFPPVAEWMCFEIADCGGAGDCLCPMVYDPVCGANGMTYGNACEAECVGISDYEMGECDAVDPEEFGCTENGEWYPFGAVIEQECNTCSCTPGFNPMAEGFWMCTMMPCEEECGPDKENYTLVMNFNGIDAGSFTVVIGDETHTIVQPVNSLTQTFNFCASPSQCIEVYSISTDAGPAFTHSLYQGDVLIGENQSSYNCDAEPCDCPLDVWDPVCGSDGTTYAYSCFAICAGVEFTEGECDDTNDCICLDIYSPVCGSNGITYGNACEAECDNITEFYEGECLPTSFCEELEVTTNTNTNESGEFILSVTVNNNSANNISYPVFMIQSTNEYVSITPQFENAYWIGAGESTTNTYFISEGGNVATWVEATYFVSQLGQNAACAYPIEFSYEPVWGVLGCYENGGFYPIGSTLEGECESCTCTSEGDAAMPPYWDCLPNADCLDNTCEGITITNTILNDDGHLEVYLTNTSSAFYSYPQLNIIDAEGNILAQEETWYYGIGPESMHTLEILIPMSEWPAYTLLQINTNFGEETACHMPIVIEDPCNLIDCAPGFTCENGDCVPEDNIEFGCEFEGELYPFGASVEQGCNSCYCQAGFNPNANGIWFCTEMACLGCTDPEAMNYDEYAVDDDGSCDYGSDNPGPGWTYQNTGTNHTLVLQEDMLTDLYGNPVEPGDWIGVFYESNGELFCGGYIIWEGSTAVIPAQGDDTTTEIQDGFAIGENFQWMVWDESENTSIYVNATYLSDDLNTFVANGISPVTELIAAPLISEQEVQLNAGWNMFSTYMTTESLEVQEVFQPYIDKTVIVKNNIGDAYLPDWDFDGIGALIPGQAYQAKMTSDITLLFEGDYLTPEDNPITLEEGWNMIAYLRTEPAAAIHVFDNVEDLVIVKNNVGMAYLPEFDFDGIGDMLPGQGYQVKVLSEQTLEYLPNDHEYRITESSYKSSLKHFETPVNTGSNMTLVIPEYAWAKNTPIELDEIAVLDTKGNRVAAMPYHRGTIAVPVYGNDELNKSKDGLFKDEPFSVILWSNKHKKTIKLKVNCKEESLQFVQDHIQIIESIAFEEEVKEIYDVVLVPNPTSTQTELNAMLEQNVTLEINILNVLGEKLYSERMPCSKGLLKRNLDVSLLAPGSYLIQVKSQNYLINKALVIQ